MIAIALIGHNVGLRDTGNLKIVLITSVHDANLIADMPVNIQIVGGKYGEEKAVAVAKVVEEALKHSAGGSVQSTTNGVA